MPSHASTDTTYGVGTTGNYGHVKLATGNMNGATHDDGVACSKSHYHAQYFINGGSLSATSANIITELTVGTAG